MLLRVMCTLMRRARAAFGSLRSYQKSFLGSLAACVRVLLISTANYAQITAKYTQLPLAVDRFSLKLLLVP